MRDPAVTRVISVGEGVVLLKPSGLQVCMHPPKGKRKESAMSNKERERGAQKTKEGSIKNYKFLLSLQSDQGVA